MTAWTTIHGQVVDVLDILYSLRAVLEPPPGYRYLDPMERPCEDSDQWWTSTQGRWSLREVSRAEEDELVLWARPIRTAGIPGGRRWVSNGEPMQTDDRLELEKPRMFSRVMSTEELRSMAKKWEADRG